MATEYIHVQSGARVTVADDKVLGDEFQPAKESKKNDKK